MIERIKVFIPLILAVLVFLGGAFVGYKFGEKKGVDIGYDNGYNAGYSAGYSAGYEDKGKLTDSSTVKTETKIEYVKIPYNGNDVQISTPPPTVNLEINGKKQEIQQKQETADVQVKTEASVKLKIPERRWSFGIGWDGKNPAYMLKAPIKGAVGAWVAGSGKHKIMGGISVSF